MYLWEQLVVLMIFQDWDKLPTQSLSDDNGLDVEKKEKVFRKKASPSYLESKKWR